MTKAEREHYDLLVSSGCCVCRKHYGVFSPAEIHHIRLNGGKRDNAPAIALCPAHHRGSQGIHHLGKTAWREKFGHENEYLGER